MSTEPQAVVDQAAVPTLMVVSGSSPGRLFRVAPVTLIGRDRRADVCLDCDGVLPLHAQICLKPSGTYELVALGLGGLRVNGDPVVRTDLSPGDQVSVGSSVRLMFTAIDRVLERAMAMQRLEAISRFAGGIAHEFNNLLGSVSSNMGYLRRLAQHRAFDLPDELAPAVEDAESAVRRATELTARLLGLADRSHADSPTDIGRMVRDVAELLQRDPPSNVRVEVAAPLGVQVKGDPAALHQALLNLCLNACDAMPDGGLLRLTVRAGAAPHRVEIVVADTGVGMDAAAKSKAFEPFFTTKPGRGTGLGLSIVERIVQEHRGEVEISSAPGAGTVVRLSLPRLDAVSEPERPMRALGDAEPVLLLIDDDALFRRGALRFLRGLGFRVTEAGDGAVALARFAQDPTSVALVVLDVLMADMSAFEILCRLKEIRPDVRVLLLTALSSSHQVEPLVELGVCGVLEKSAGADALHRGILLALGAED